MLRIAAVVGTTLLTTVTLLGAGPALAQAPPAPAAGTSTTVSTDCLGGGTLVVRQTQLGSGDTRVTIRATGVPNGRWKGSFAPDASEVDHDIDLAVTAVHHRFHKTLLVGDVTGDTNTTLVRGDVSKACALGLTLTAKTVSISSPVIGLVARSPKPGTLITAGVVIGCHGASTWEYGVSADFGQIGLGFGAGGIPCRHGVVKISKSTSTFEPAVAGPPTALSLKAHSHGDVRRISYRSSTAR